MTSDIKASSPVGVSIHWKAWALSSRAFEALTVPSAATVRYPYGPRSKARPSGRF